MSELDRLVKYAEDRGLKVIFTDSRVLHDYAAMNPEAAEAMDFPDIDNKTETREILVDKTLPLAAQVRNLKHELIEYELMRNGMQYWPAHLRALELETKPFNYKQSTNFFARAGRILRRKTGKVAKKTGKGNIRLLRAIRR